MLQIRKISTSKMICIYCIYFIIFLTLNHQVCFTHKMVNSYKIERMRKKKSKITHGLSSCSLSKLYIKFNFFFLLCWLKYFDTHTHVHTYWIHAKKEIKFIYRRKLLESLAPNGSLHVGHLLWRVSSLASIQFLQNVCIHLVRIWVLNLVLQVLHFNRAYIR